MILVTGANGQLGRKTVELLLEKTDPKNIAVSVRDPQKAQILAQRGISVRKGDFHDVENLPKAFEGADIALIISTSEPTELRTQSHKNAIDAAKKAGVKHVVYTSFVHDRDDLPYALARNHINTEAHLRESGLTYTIIREGLYLDVLPMMLGNVVETRKIFYPSNGQPVSYVLRNDIAEGLANILTGRGHENKVYNFTLEKAHTFAELAAILSEIIGEKVEYVDISKDAYAEGMRQHGVPEAMINIMLDIAGMISDGIMNKPDTQLTALLGRKPVDLKPFLQEAFGKKAQ